MVLIVGCIVSSSRGKPIDGGAGRGCYRGAHRPWLVTCTMSVICNAEPVIHTDRAKRHLTVLLFTNLLYKNAPVIFIWSTVKTLRESKESVDVFVSGSLLSQSNSVGPTSRAPGHLVGNVSSGVTLLSFQENVHFILPVLRWG